MKKTLSLLFLVCAVLSGCKHLDDDRIPYVPVLIEFSTVGVWDQYGVSGAAQNKEFLLSNRATLNKPAGFPFNANSATGFGGVMLVTDYDGQYQAYDMACPVECRSNIRIVPVDNSGKPCAECPECHSKYDIYRWGGPISGPAARKGNGYGLTRYRVLPGASGIYMVIRH